MTANFGMQCKFGLMSVSTEGCMLSVVDILFVQSELGCNCEGGGVLVLEAC